MKHSTESFPYGIPRHCQTKKFWQKIVILPPFLSINVLATGNFLKHSTVGFPYGIFRHCETKNFDRKAWYSLPLLIHNFLANGIFLKHSTEGFLDGILRHCQTKMFWQKIVILPPSSDMLPPSHPWTFSIPEISEPLRGSPTKNFGNVRRKNFDGKSWYSSPSYP